MIYVYRRVKFKLMLILYFILSLLQTNTILNVDVLKNVFLLNYFLLRSEQNLNFSLFHTFSTSQIPSTVNLLAVQHIFGSFILLC